MIHLLATRYQKKAALLLFASLYLQLTLPIAVRVLASPLPTHIYTAYQPGTADKNQAMPGFLYKMPFGPQEKEQRQITAGSAKSREQKTERTARPNIGGPGQPEMSSFKSVNSNDMVDLFS